MIFFGFIFAIIFSLEPSTDYRDMYTVGVFNNLSSFSKKDRKVFENYTHFIKLCELE